MFVHNQYPDEIYTGFWVRFFAYGLDLIIVASLQRMLLFYFQDGLLRTGLNLLVLVAYFVLMTKLNKGQTLGKMAFGIRVVCFSEGTLSWSTVIVRELFGRLMQKTLWIMYIIVGFTPKKQHVVDLLCDTSVITENYLLFYHPDISPQAEINL